MIKFIIFFLVGSFSYGQLIIDSYKFDVPVTNIYPLGNAASSDDVASSSGWSNESDTTVSWVATDTPAGGGSNVIEVTSLEGSNDRSIFTFTATIGTVYSYSIWGRELSGGQASIKSWLGVVTSPTYFYSTTWEEATGTIEATSTTVTMRFYASTNAGAGLKGQFDLITITEL